MARLWLCLWIGCSVAMAAEYRLLVDWHSGLTPEQKQAQQQGMLLFAEMVPSGSRAGIWWYADQIQPVVPLAQVGPNWRAQARTAIGRNPNLGAGSQLGQALDQVGLSMPTTGSHLILLADGRLRANVDSAGLIRERNRILQQQLPSLRTRGVQVQTISLSASGDEQLLQFLAYRTNGQSQLLASPQQLPQAMARAMQLNLANHDLPLLPRVSPAVAARPSGPTAPVRVPTTIRQPVGSADPQVALSAADDYLFTLDDQVLQVHIWLQSRQPDALQLLSPEGEWITWRTERPDVTWREAGDWQLIQLQQPLAGDWQLRHGMAQPPVIEMVSDWQLQISGIRSRVAPGEPLLLSLSLLPESLSDVEYALTAQHLATGEELQAQASAPGQFLPLSLTADGAWLLTAQASRHGAQRVRTWRVEQQSPLVVELQHLPQGVQLLLNAWHAELDPMASSLAMELRGPNSQSNSAMTPSPDGFAAFAALTQPGEYQVRFAGQLAFQQAEQAWQSPWYAFTWPLPEPVTHPSPTASVAVSSTLVATVEATAEAGEQPLLEVEAPAAEPKSTMRYLMYALALLPGLLFFALIFWLYRRIDRKLQTTAALVDEQEVADEQALDQTLTSSVAGIDLGDMDMDLSDLPNPDAELQDEPTRAPAIEVNVDTGAKPAAESLVMGDDELESLLDDELISLSETEVSSSRQEDMQQVDELQKSLDELASQYENDELTGLDVGDEELDLDSLDSAWFEAGQELPEADLPDDDKPK